MCCSSLKVQQVLVDLLLAVMLQNAPMRCRIAHVASFFQLLRCLREMFSFLDETVMFY